MTKLLTRLANDEAGFIVSAELVLVSTIVVLSMIVGLSEVSIAVNNELNDVGAAFGSINQTFCYSGLTGCKGHRVGSSFQDHVDMCDSQFDVTCNTPPMPEGPKMAW